jgi:hypothetical protein
MKLWISALVGMFAMLAVWMPRPVAAAEPLPVQHRMVEAHDWRHDAHYRPWYGAWGRDPHYRPWYGGACRDPNFRRHHPFLCW